LGLLQRPLGQLLIILTVNIMVGFELVVIDDRDSALVEVVVNSEAFVLPTHHRGDYIITVQELVNI